MGLPPNMVLNLEQNKQILQVQINLHLSMLHKSMSFI